MRTAALLSAIAIVFGVASCGGGTRHPPAVAASRPVTVSLGEYFFRPRRATVKAGAPIRFVNVGHIEHTVADSTKTGTIRSSIIHPRPLARGQSQTVVLRRPGTVYYLCTFHPQLMRGVLTVTR
jgi:plastocyanin